MRRLRTGSAALIAAGVLSGALLGCGGAGIPGTTEASLGDSASVAATGRGRLDFRVAWPSKTRVVPGATGSIRIDVRQGATVVATTLVASPATTATIGDVPVGAFTVRATAYDNAAGTGTALARGEVPAVVLDGAATAVPVTMTSTVNSLSVSPPSYSLLLGLLGAPMLNVTARDADNNPVLVASGDLEFTSSNPLVVTVSAIGKLTGLLSGSATITVRERTSGRTVAVPVTLL